MNRVLFLCMLLCMVPFISAAVTIDAPKDVPVLIVGSDNESVTYALKLTNTGESDDFQIYSLVGVELSPSTIHLEADTPTTVTITAKPVRRLLDNTKGLVKFQYEIFSTREGLSQGELFMDLVTLPEALFIRPVSVEVGDNESKIMIQNLKGIRFSNMDFAFKSKLFDTDSKVTIGPFETIPVTIQIDADATRKLVADTYPLEVRVSYQGAEGTIISNVKYLEQGGIAVAESSEGVVIRTKTTEKVNEGNVPVTATISEKRDIFTRLLTNHNPAPETASKRGFYVVYTWQEQLEPSEKLVVQSTTNYTLPLIMLIIIAVIVIAVKFFMRSGLSLVKRVSFVRTKGGEFALKVTIHAKAHGPLQNVVLTDRVPHAMKLYESYGIKPHAIDEATRTITWNLPHLNAGEERVFSYIIYSKIRVVGSFELPLAHARFTQKGKQTSVFSNKTSFAAEISQTRD